MTNTSSTQTPEAPLPEEQDFDSFAEARRETRRNYLLHATEGGIYMGALSLLTAESVAPAMVAALGGSEFLIALMPMLMMMGISWPALCIAHWVERLPRVMPLLIWVTLAQRLPYLFTGLALILLADSHPRTVLTMVLLTPFLSGSCCGLTFPAWIELVSKTVSKRLRSPLWATRNIIGGIMGLGAGGVIAFTLSVFPGAKGFGILHLVLFGLLMISYALFLNIREPFHEHRLKAPVRNLKENLKDIPGLLRQDASLRNFTFMRICAMGLYIMLPFLAIYALDVTSRSSAFLGWLVAAQMAGSIAGNLLAGAWGNRSGGRLPAAAGRGFQITACILALLTAQSTGFLMVFFFLGLGTGMVNVGAMSLSIDICPADRRPTYVAFLTTLIMPAALLMAMISALLKRTTDSFAVMAAATILLITVATFFNLRIREHPDPDA